jgi:hypothetical protein
MLVPLSVATCAIPQFGLGFIIKSFISNNSLVLNAVTLALLIGSQIWSQSITSMTTETVAIADNMGMNDQVGFQFACWTRHVWLNAVMVFAVFVFPPVTYVSWVGQACGLVSNGGYAVSLAFTTIFAIVACLALPCCQCLTCFYFVSEEQKQAFAQQMQEQPAIKTGMDGRPVVASHQGKIGGIHFNLVEQQR